ncbi:hypothetical protein H1R20_g4001, partial [Candolleomyces eurysporus]
MDDTHGGEHSENVSGVRNAEAQAHYTALMIRDVAIHNAHYHGPVNIGHAENTNFGTNSGTISQATASPPAAGNWQFVSNKELNQLLDPIPDASYTRNRKTSPPDSDCFPGTREEVIQDITDWADRPTLFSSDTPHVYWTHGYVSCGKSAISQTLSRKYAEKGRLPASFFFCRNSGDRSKMTKFAVTLASQMVAAIPSTRLFVKAAVKAEPALATRGVSLATQLERLVYKPFQAVLKRGLILKTLLKGPFLIVIDGLDECEDKEEVKEFINHLLDFFKRHPSIPLRFFITSRVELHIQECLNTDGVLLDDLVTRGSEGDILTFLGTSFLVQAKKDLVIAAYIRGHGQWPTRKDMKMLVHHIGGSFIFASIVFKYIIGPLDDSLTPMTRLPLAFNMNPGLDGLYAHTLTRSRHLLHFTDNSLASRHSRFFTFL